MLLAGAQDEHEPVVALQVTFDVQPVEVFEAHRNLSKKNDKTEGRG